MKELTVALIACIFAFAAGCSTSPQYVSQESVEAKIASVMPGQTTMGDVQVTFGPAHLMESRFWVYNFSDTDMDLTEYRTRFFGRSITPLPFSLASNVPTNTRALITFRFNDAGVVKGFEVERYFVRPYIHDYWYLVKPEPETALKKVAEIGDTSGFKVITGDSPGSLLLPDPGRKARGAAKGAAEHF